MKQLILLSTLAACGLSETQVKNIAKDASGYALCVEICVNRSQTDEEFSACTKGCDKQFGLNSEEMLGNVLKALPK